MLATKGTYPVPALKRPILGATILTVLLVLPACQRESKLGGQRIPGGDPNLSSTDLEHFDGQINTNDHTLDHALADLYTRASKALQAGDAETAEAIYQEATKKYPADPTGYTSLGACLYFQEKYEDAEREYLRALKLDPGSVGALYGLGCVAYKTKRFPQARDHLNKALAVDEKHSLSHRMLGIVYADLGDRAQAIVHLERAIELDPRVREEKSVMSRLNKLKSK
jgi:tetratricopeptide (TPR) repeat protein